MGDKLISYFLATQFPTLSSTEEEIELMHKQGHEFNMYLWNDSRSLDEKLKILKPNQYGLDIELMLFEFYLNPLPKQFIAYNKKTIDYRKNEKAIGIKIIITNDNFFNKEEEQRRNFLKQAILQKMELLAEVVKKRKLDTNVDLLKSDLQKVLKEFSVT